MTLRQMRAKDDGVESRRHGASTQDIPAERFVVFSQDHDQVGNRMNGRRSYSPSRS
jgi:1,4-alpha-glucan branching enzyme